MRTVLCAALLSAAAAGCVPPGFVQPETNAVPATEPLVSRPKARTPAVRPEQVSEDNARNIAEALGQEIAADTKGEAAPEKKP